MFSRSRFEFHAAEFRRANNFQDLEFQLRREFRFSINEMSEIHGCNVVITLVLSVLYLVCTYFTDNV